MPILQSKYRELIGEGGEARAAEKKRARGRPRDGYLLAIIPSLTPSPFYPSYFTRFSASLCALSLSMPT